MTGYNLEGSEIGAAFGLVQLQKLKKNISISKIILKDKLNFLVIIPIFS